MNDDERAVLKQKIQDELDRLAIEIAELEENTKPISPDNAIGRVSRMDAIGNKMVNEQVLNKALERQYKLQSVLDRTSDPDFGICRGCGQSIPVARLLALPESAFCVGCAQ